MLIATVDDRPITLDHALIELVVSGRWADIRRRLRRGVERELRGDPVDDDAQRAVEIGFRRRHRLLAADDLRTWLDERAVSVSEWRAHLGRGLLGDTAADVDDCEPEIDDAAIDGRVAELALVTLRLGGHLADSRDRLVEATAALDLAFEQSVTPCAPSDDDVDAARSALADPALPLVSRDVDQLARVVATVRSVASARDVATAAVSARELREHIAEQRLDWTLVRFDDVVLGTAGAAREVVLCVRVDGLDLAEVAGRAGVAVGHHECTAAEAGSAAAPLLLAASIGAPLGPVAHGEHWRVMVLRARHVPDDDDPEIRARAAEAVMADRLRRHLAGRVTHHAHL